VVATKIRRGRRTQQPPPRGREKGEQIFFDQKPGDPLNGVKNKKGKGKPREKGRVSKPKTR